jgi:hypothetical protein
MIATSNDKGAMQQIAIVFSFNGHKEGVHVEVQYGPLVHGCLWFKLVVSGQWSVVSGQWSVVSLE